MRLRSSPPSPFGRKVKIAAHLMGLKDQIAVELADTTNPADTLRTQNPLGKIPALILDDGRVLYDSRVICEYLDGLHQGAKLFPADPEPRFHALTLQALADGVMDAAILQIYEKRMRPEDKWHQPWLDYQADKVARGLAALEATPLPAAPAYTIGDITVACALGYLDLRFGGRWRENYPRLVAWLDGFSAHVPAFEATRFHP